MIKIIEAYGRKQGFTREEFFAYQKEEHMKKAGMAPGFTSKIRGSYQNALILPEEEPAVAGIHDTEASRNKDSVVEIFFDDAKEALAAFHDPIYMEIVRPDEEAFSDTANGWSVMVTENLLFEKEEAPSLEKMFIFLKLREGYEAEWENVLENLKSYLPKTGVQKAVENIRILDAALENGRDFDRILEFWYASRESLIQAVMGRTIERFVKTLPFTDSESLVMFCAKEAYNVPK